MNIKTDFEDMGRRGLELNQVTRDKAQYQGLGNTVTKLRVPQITRN
jgi:hypothetical protein